MTLRNAAETKKAEIRLPSGLDRVCPQFIEKTFIRFSVDQDEPAPLLNILDGPRQDHAFGFARIGRTHNLRVHRSLSRFHINLVAVTIGSRKNGALSRSEDCGFKVCISLFLPLRPDDPDRDADNYPLYANDLKTCRNLFIIS